MTRGVHGYDFRSAKRTRKRTNNEKLVGVGTSTNLHYKFVLVDPKSQFLPGLKTFPGVLGDWHDLGQYGFVCLQ